MRLAGREDFEQGGLDGVGADEAGLRDLEYNVRGAPGASVTVRRVPLCEAGWPTWLPWLPTADTPG